MQEVEGKVAVITGAAGGIGLGMARAFAGVGMSLVLADIDGERLGGTVAALRDDDADVIGVPTDVGDAASMGSLADTALDQYGAVHLLACNAGGPLPRSVMELTGEDWDRVLSSNLFGVINGIQAFFPIMEAQGEGHINATSSMSGLLAFPPVATYNVAKFGVIALMETLARELRQRGSPVEVSVLCPAEVATRGVGHMMSLARASGYEASEAELAMVEQAQSGLLSGGMSPNEVGQIVLEGIRERRFWIFTHPDVVKGPIRERFEAMVRDGSLPDF